MPPDLTATRLIGGLLVCITLSAADGAAQPSFQGIGDLPGGAHCSVAAGVGLGGTPVVAGWSESALEREAYRWEPGGLTPLGTLGGGNWSEATAVSADGSVIVGVSNTWPPWEQAFRWTAAEGLVGLGFVAGGSYSSAARGANSDGSVIVGVSQCAGGAQAFRWTAPSGMVGLGDLPGGYLSSEAEAVSADGSVVVGIGQTGTGHAAFRWTEAEGIVSLFEPPHPPGYESLARATAVSAAGDVIAGYYHVGGNLYQGFRWTTATSMVPLLDPAGVLQFGEAYGISADGSMIVGTGRGGEGALLWTADGGVLRIADLLADTYGLDLSGWYLSSATAISADGTVIVGDGSGPHGEEAWIAVIPEPAGPGLLAALGALARRRPDRTHG